MQRTRGKSRALLNSQQNYPSPSLHLWVHFLINSESKLHHKYPKLCAQIYVLMAHLYFTEFSVCWFGFFGLKWLISHHLLIISHHISGFSTSLFGSAEINETAGSHHVCLWLLSRQEQPSLNCIISKSSDYWTSQSSQLHLTNIHISWNRNQKQCFGLVLLPLHVVRLRHGNKLQSSCLLRQYWIDPVLFCGAF